MINIIQYLICMKHTNHNLKDLNYFLIKENEYIPLDQKVLPLNLPKFTSIEFTNRCFIEFMREKKCLRESLREYNEIGERRLV